MLVNFMCLAVKLATATGMSAVGTCSHYNTNLIIDSIGCVVIFLQLAVFTHNSMDHRAAHQCSNGQGFPRALTF